MGHKDIHITYEKCPYCGVKLDPVPKRNKPCPSCREMIYVRTNVQTRNKMLMSRDDALYYRGVPIYDNLPVRGSKHTAICVCHECGHSETYRFRFGIDHFPLSCKKCDALAVYRLFNDEMSDLDFFRLLNAASGIGKE